MSHVAVAKNLYNNLAYECDTAMALVERLVLRGARVHVVSRGYGGSLRGPVQVNPNHHSAIKSLSAAFWDSTIGRNPAATAASGGGCAPASSCRSCCWGLG